MPGRVLLVPLLVGAAAGVYLQHGTLVGQEAGVTFLLLLMALKLLEMRARRDVFVVIFLCFFILLTQFMYSQGPAVALMTLMAVAALFFVLVSVNLDEADLPAARKMKMVGRSLLKAAPLTIVLFLLFPRISGPLWGMPGDAASGGTGLSNSMSPGSIGNLIESREIAFRVKFDGNATRPEQLYWRGPVFGSFNGRTWSPLSRAPWRPAPDDRGRPRSGGRLHDHARAAPARLAVRSGGARRPAGNRQLERATDAEMELLAGDLVRERTRYAMRSYLGFRSARRECASNCRTGWRCPRRTTRARTSSRRSCSGASRQAPQRDLRLVRAVLEHFRTGGYGYTLSPPRLGRHSVDEFLFDTKRGYCEHYFVGVRGDDARRSAFPRASSPVTRAANRTRSTASSPCGNRMPTPGPKCGCRDAAGRGSIQRRWWRRFAIDRRSGGRAHRRESVAIPVFGAGRLDARAALQLGGGAEQLEPVGAVLLAGAPARAGGNARAGAALGKRGHGAGGGRRPPRRRHGGGVDALARGARSAR